MSLKADSFCATINLQGLGKQHMNSPEVNFCLSSAQAEPPLDVRNSGMAVPTKAAACRGHSTNLQSSMLCDGQRSQASDGLGENRDCSHQAQHRGHLV